MFPVPWNVSARQAQRRMRPDRSGRPPLTSEVQELGPGTSDQVPCRTFDYGKHDEDLY